MMKNRLTEVARLPENVRTAVTVGTFDGVHRGHLEILKELLKVARRQGLRSLVITFEPHPGHVLHPGNKIKPLTDTPLKVRLLTELGLDYLALLHFDRALSRVGPERFVSDYLISRFGMRTLVVGYDHAFGSNRAGNEKVLTELSASRNFTLIKVPPVLLDGQPVSSSRIRTALSEGNMPLASKLLGRFYSFTGQVVTGSGRGKKLGHPTANLVLLNQHKQLFPDGIYAGFVDLDGKIVHGVLHHGPRPTFNDSSSTLELNLFDFNGSLYGRRLEVSIIQRIRPVLRFETAEELIRQMDRDDQEVKKVFERIKIPTDSLSRAV